jgi:UDP-N-acetylglucosamine--N-acetylmuramyl-(pentapeptide) pyrophosphoryl-undecaprenol N-acetylglucosamine transferase
VTTAPGATPGPPESGAVFALVTGGGTGGHVYPALALADALVQRGHPRSSIRFLGASRGLEARAVPDAGYEIDLLPARGFQRGITPKHLVDNARMVVSMIVAMFAALRIVRRARPRVVVGVGGYASLPGVLAARVLRVPIVIHEQNAVPGLANRLATRLGARAAVSLPGTDLRGAVVTGNPVRASVATVVRAPESDRALLGVVGGSLGSPRLNDAALDLYDRWRARSDISVRHISGPRHYDQAHLRLERLRRPQDALVYELVAYEDHMEGLYGRAALAVCRAGAVTVSELAAAGVPSVLVPWPGAADDHQTGNARAMEAAGAAVLLPDDECDGGRLDVVAGELLADPDRLRTMATAARSVARPDAADRLADLVEEAAGAGA